MQNFKHSLVTHGAPDRSIEECSENKYQGVNEGSNTERNLVDFCWVGSGNEY